MATTKGSSRVRDLDDMPVSGGQGERRKQPSDVIVITPLPDGKYKRLRPIGGVTAIAGHWIKTKKKDGTPASFYMPCPAWDTETSSRQGGDGSEHCAWCRNEAKEKAAEVDPQKRLSRFSVDYYSNFIDRVMQKKGPPESSDPPTPEEKASGFKDKESETWTPCVAVRLTSSGIRSMKDLKQLNTHDDDEGNTKAFAISHPEYGCDINILKDKEKPPANMYAFQKGEHSPLTKAEKRYLQWDLSDLTEYPTSKEVEEEFAKWAAKMGVKGVKKASGDDEEEEDLDEVKTKKKKPALDDFDDDDDDVPAKKPVKKKAVDDEDEEDDDVPVKKAVKKKPVVDDEEEEDEPPKKKPAKKAIARPAVDLDDEEEDDAPPKKKKKPALDDFDDDDDDAPAKKPVKKKPAIDEDDDDDAPPPKKKKPPVEDEEDDDPPPKKKPVKKKPADDEFDDEEEESPPPKKKKKPVEDDDDGL